MSDATQDLSLDDFKPQLQEITFLGKRAFIRKLNVDAQFFLETLTGKSDAVKLRHAMVLALCDSAGELVFRKEDGEADMEAGLKAMKNVPATEMIKSFSAINKQLADELESLVKK
jgi:hypothetical protein